jgi:hypothetical protein
LRRAEQGFVRASQQDKPSTIVDEIRTIATGADTAQMLPRAVKTLAASVIMNRA